MRRDPVRVAMMWIILLTYGGPTVFMVMCWLAGIMPFAWWMFLWGGGACLVALMFGERPIRQGGCR